MKYLKYFEGRISKKEIFKSITNQERRNFIKTHTLIDTGEYFDRISNMLKDKNYVIPKRHVGINRISISDGNNDIFHPKTWNLKMYSDEWFILSKMGNGITTATYLVDSWDGLRDAFKRFFKT